MANINISTMLDKSIATTTEESSLKEIANLDTVGDSNDKVLEKPLVISRQRLKHTEKNLRRARSHAKLHIEALQRKNS